MSETDAGDRPSARSRGADSRRRGREAAVQMLYQWQLAGTGIDEAVDAFGTIDPVPGGVIGARALAFGAALARGTAAGIERVDRLIADQTEHWRPSRLAAVDRQILRVAVYELLAGETPQNVIINEAIELARTFGGDDSASFVNGVLDAVKRRLARGDGDSAAGADGA